MDSVRTPPGVSLMLDARRSRRPARLASVVLEELAHRIIGGAFPEGSVLPTEPVLCEQFGFSRTVIREGLKQLEERGLVRVEQGRGTTVQPRDSWNLLDPAVIRIALAYDSDMSLLDDLISVRRVLEREMACAAAQRLTEGELAALAENIERMKATYDDYPRFREARQRLPRDRHEGVRKRGRADDRPHDPHARRRQASARLGRLAGGAEADGERTPRDLRRPGRTGRRGGRQAHLHAHPHRVGREEEGSARSLDNM